MNLFFCDASALGKRYVAEAGTPLINRLFERIVPDRLIVLTQGIGETLSIIVRRHNSGKISDGAYQSAIRALRAELIQRARTRLQATDDMLVFASLRLIEQHSINSTDALVLMAALQWAAMLAADGTSLVFVASDARLLRAASAEGLAVFNPETGSEVDLDALIDAP